MAGGIFITHNKVRPGFYHKFIAQPRAKQLMGELGVAALPLPLDWGKTGEMIAIDADAHRNEFIAKLGYPREQLQAVDQALKRARRLLVYRVGEGSKASLIMEAVKLTATAKCAGKRGNDLQVSITQDMASEGKHVIHIYMDGTLLFTQSGVEKASDILENDYVTFEGTGAIAVAAGGSLTGGTTGQPTPEDYQNFLRALDSHEFNAFGLCGGDEDVKLLFAEATKRYIQEQGKLVQCFLTDFDAQYEGVSAVVNGVVLEDGRVLDKSAVIAWLVGISSAAGPARSLTYTPYDGAVAPDIRFDDAQIQAALRGGKLVFVGMKDVLGQDIAAIEQDVNTLTRFTEERPPCWGKNRVVRALFFLVNSLTRIWHLYYVGKVDNNAAGRDLFKADLVTLMRELVSMGAFEDFDAQKDIQIVKGDASDSVVCSIACQPVDAMEKMYFTIEVK